MTDIPPDVLPVLKVLVVFCFVGFATGLWAGYRSFDQTKHNLGAPTAALDVFFTGVLGALFGGVAFVVLLLLAVGVFILFQ